MCGMSRWTVSVEFLKRMLLVRSLCRRWRTGTQTVDSCMQLQAETDCIQVKPSAGCIPLSLLSVLTTIIYLSSGIFSMIEYAAQHVLCRQTKLSLFSLGQASQLKHMAPVYSVNIPSHINLNHIIWAARRESTRTQNRLKCEFSASRQQKHVNTC